MTEESRPHFMRSAPLVQALMASGDNLTGSYAMLYAVGRGSYGFIQGLITSIQQLGAAILQPVWGAASDKIGRRLFMVVGFLVQSMMWGYFLPRAQNAVEVLLVLTVQTLLGTMVLPVWNAWLGDYTDISDRGRVFGKFGMVASWIALTIFSLVSLYIQEVDPTRSDVNSFSIAFRVAGLFYLSAAVLVLFIPQAVRFRGRKSVSYKTMVAGFLVNRQMGFRERFRNGVRTMNGDFKRFLLIDGLFRISWSMAWPIFPYATLSATDSWVELIILQVVIGLSIGVSQLIGGKFADRYGRKSIILWTRIFLVLPPALTALGVLQKNSVYLIVANLVVGLTLGATGIAINSLILDTAPKGKESTYFSIYIFVMGIVGFSSSILMGGVLNVLSGDSIPSDTIVSLLLIIAAGVRLVAWTSYFFLKETKPSGAVVVEKEPAQ